MTTKTTTAPALYVRPANPGTLAVVPRLQQRTARSFEAEAPPDRLATWLMDHGFKPHPRSANQKEYARFARGRTAEGKPAELAIVYWSGSVVAAGPDSATVAALLASIAEEAPATATMFDSLAEAEGGAL